MKTTRLASLLVLLVFLPGCELLPEAASTFAGPVDMLFYVILWVTGIAFVATELLLVYFLIRYRSRKGQKAVYTHGNHRLELAWTIIPGAILVILAVAQAGTWQDMKMDFPDEKDAVVVEVLAQQFTWNFRYPGNDGEFGITPDEDGYALGSDDVLSTKLLIVPVNRPVILVMRTRDVIHSFFVREFRVKQDVTPGMVNRAWFQATKEGDYEIGCAELCGAEHWTMRALLQVRSQEEFDAEIARRSEAAVEFEHDFNNPAEVWPWVETQKATGRARREAAAKKDGDEQR